MDQQGFTPVWGVVGLNGSEQRRVRGGSHRASCIRSAYLNYRTDVRTGGRSSARSNLLSALASCSSGYGC